MGLRICPWDQFPEPLTGGATCSDCDMVCNPIYATKELCQKYCPEYLKKTNGTHASTTPLAHYSSSVADATSVSCDNSATLDERLGYAVVTVCVVILIVSIGFIGYLFCKKYRKVLGHRERSEEALEEDQEERQPMAPDKAKDIPPIPADPSRPASGSISSESEQSTGSQAPLLKKTKPEEAALDNTAMKSMSKTPSVSINFSNTGQRRRHDSSDVGDLSSLAIRFETDTMSFGRNTNQLDLVSYIRELSLRSDDPMMSTVGPQTGNTWQEVMNVYDAIDQHLLQMSWIRGCALSSRELHVVADTTARTRAVEIWKMIRNIVPENIPSERFRLTFEGPSMRALCGNVGAGCTVSNETGKFAKLTILGSAHQEGSMNVPNVYMFTVAHAIHREADCQIHCRCEGKMFHTQSDHCLGSVSSVKSDVTEDIGHKIYDLSIVQLNDATGADNKHRLILNGRQVILDVELARTKVAPRDVIPGRRVLVFGDHHGNPINACIADTAAITCRGHSGQITNLIQIRSLDPERSISQPGQSGSLVVWHPGDLSSRYGIITVQAFAVIIGAHVQCPANAYAIPLWDQMERLFHQEKSLAHLKDTIVFNNRADSGIYSQQ